VERGGERKSPCTSVCKKLSVVQGGRGRRRGGPQTTGGGKGSKGVFALTGVSVPTEGSVRQIGRGKANQHTSRSGSREIVDREGSKGARVRPVTLKGDTNSTRALSAGRAEGSGGGQN